MSNKRIINFYFTLILLIGIAAPIYAGDFSFFAQQVQELKNFTNHQLTIVNKSAFSCSGTTISSFPYSESFESGMGDWTQVSNGLGDDIDWTRDASGTPSGSTGPSSAVDGSYYLYTEASTNVTPAGSPNKVATLNSPCFDLSAATAADFNFQYHMYGSNVGTLDVEVSTNSGSSWTNLWTQSGNIGDLWNSVTISLNAYVGQAVQLRFVGTTGSGWSSDITFDDISLTATISEVCDNGIDDDGDGDIDCADSDCGGEQTISVRVASGNDDAEENVGTGSIGLTSSDLELSHDGATNQIIGMRFNGISIPQGATITSAYLEFETDELDSGTTNLNISAENTDNATTFTTATNNISSRSKTSAISWSSVSAWNTADQKHQSPDIASIIQQVVNRSGWTSGNSMALFIDGTGERTAESYNGEAAAAPLLVINYCGSSSSPTFSCVSGLLSNPDFESGSTGWNFSSNTSISNDAYFGSQAAYANGSSGGTGQNYAASVGQTYSLEVYAKKNGSESTVVGIKFFDSSWNELEASYIEVTSSTYEVYYVSLVAPANTAWVQPLGWKNAGSGEAWWDGFCFEQWNIIAPTCANTSCEILPTYSNYNFALDDSGVDAHWMEYDNGGLILCDNGDGTLSIKGNIIGGRDAAWGSGIAAPCSAQDGWLVDFTIFDMQSWAEFGGSYAVDGACPNAYQNLDYWDVTGTLTGLGCNAGRTITFTPSMGYRLQIGVGGNSQSCDFGMSTWFAGLENGNSVKADIYAHLDSTCYMSMRPTPTNICTNGVDTDGDGVNDICDLDDDNDGILDEDEWECSGTTSFDFATLATSSNQTIAQLENIINNSASNINGSTMNINITQNGTGLNDYLQIQDNHHTNVYGIYARDYNNPTYADAIAYEITFDKALEDFTFKILDVDDGDAIEVFGYHEGIEIPYVYNLYASTLVTYAGNNQFTSLPNTESALDQDLGTIDLDFTGYLVDSIVIKHWDSDPHGTITITTFTAPCAEGDTDGDGTPDHKDADSDDDGCPDAIEGAGTFSSSDLDGNDRLIGSVDANGVPSVVGATGQGTTAAITDVGVNNCGEICDNGIDDDSDGQIDNLDGDCCPNDITNEKFDNGTTDWLIYQQSGASATFTIDNSSQLSGTNSAFVNISATNGNSWDIQLTQINLKIGQ